ncbi:hypothetical protein PINS_up014055 [Pythium insidiosum]|nr:hypothetical protein PINS_up014055 [Pythium insidiosum]
MEIEEETKAVVAQEATAGGVTMRRTTVRSSRRSMSDDLTQRKVDALAVQTASVQAFTAEEMNKVRLQQEELARKTTEYLEQQYANQLELNRQQEAMKAQMLEHQRFLNEQYGLLRAADEAMSQQKQKIDVLAAAVQAPAPEVRWGLFAQPNQQHVGDVKTEPDQAVMIATGANMPTPPLYRGSTKKEKRAFMDSYLVYERRALNQGANAKVFTMPIGACIEHRTLMRICQFELFRSDTEISEAEWRHYSCQPSRLTRWITPG